MLSAVFAFSGILAYSLVAAAEGRLADYKSPFRPTPPTPPPLAALVAQPEGALRFDYPRTAAEQHELSVLLGLPPSTHIENVGPGALLIDFGNNSIPAKQLASVLARLSSIPAHTFPDDFPLLLRAVTLRNATVHGSLHLASFVLRPSLIFDNVSFTPVAPGTHALRIDDVTFVGDVSFKSPVFFGPVHVTGSRFDERLSLQTPEFRGPPFSAAPLRIDNSIFRDDVHFLHGSYPESTAPVSADGTSTRTANAPTIIIGNSRLAGTTRFEHTVVSGAVQMENNTLDTLWIDRSRIRGLLSFILNDVSNRVEVRGAYLHGGLTIQQNYIANDLRISDSDLYWPNEDRGLAIALNRIGRELFFAPRTLEVPREEVLLNHNHIGNFMTVSLPALLALTTGAFLLDLSHNVVDGRTFISETFVNEADMPRAPPGASPFTEYCFDALPTTYGTDGVSEQSETARLYINLAHARLDSLVWGLPIADCTYQWLGEGLEFREWVPGTTGRRRLDQLDLSDGRNQGLLYWMERWKYQMALPDPTFFLFLAEKLRARGSFGESRAMLTEAKRMDFMPIQCEWRSVAFWDADHCFRQNIVYYALWPTGFGARPERALVWLVVSTAVGLVVYYTYSLNRRKRFMRWLWRRAALAYCSVTNSRPRWNTYQRLKKSYWFLFVSDKKQTSGTDGFRPYETGREPDTFPLYIFNLDAALPVVNFHAYDFYYPENLFVRMFSYVQHAVGWWMFTIFIASLAVL